LFCLFFHLPPQKIELWLSFVLCQSYAKQVRNVSRTSKRCVAVVVGAPHVVKKLKISFRWKKKTAYNSVLFPSLVSRELPNCPAVFSHFYLHYAPLTCAWFSAIVSPFSSLTIFTFPSQQFFYSKQKKTNQINKNKRKKYVSILGSEMYVSSVLCLVCTVMILHVLISWTRKKRRHVKKLNPKFSVSGKPIYNYCCVVS
jgi:hypothetical protein